MSGKRQHGLNVRVTVRGKDTNEARKAMRKLAKEINESGLGKVEWAMIAAPRRKQGRITHYEWTNVAGL